MLRQKQVSLSQFRPLIREVLQFFRMVADLGLPRASESVKGFWP